MLMSFCLLNEKRWRRTITFFLAKKKNCGQTREMGAGQTNVWFLQRLGADWEIPNKSRWQGVAGSNWQETGREGYNKIKRKRESPLFSEWKHGAVEEKEEEEWRWERERERKKEEREKKTDMNWPTCGQLGSTASLGAPNVCSASRHDLSRAPKRPIWLHYIRMP